MAGESGYWFRAKRFGWGWGLPLRWQGWLVLLAYGALFVLGIVLFPLPSALIGYVVYISLISAVLVWICYVKGEPPKWRWGR